MFRGSSGRSLLARLEIDSSGLDKFDNRVSRTARHLRQELDSAAQSAQNALNNRVNKSIRDTAAGFLLAERRARDFSKTPLGIVADGLDEIYDKTKKISIAAGVGTAFGVKEANNLFRQNKILEALSKNQAQVVQRQKQFRDLADQTGQSYLTILEAANILLPTIGRTNADLSQALTLVQRLALQDPAQGVEGAAIALREALSGEARSLAFRFELPRAAVRQAINEAGGDPQRLIESLDKLIARYGISSDRFIQLMNSGINSFQRLKDTFRNAMGEAFMPFLTEFLIPGANRLSDFLQNLIDNHRGVLAISAALISTTAALSPMAFILSKLITIWGIFGNQIKIASKNMVEFGKSVVTSRFGAVAGGVGLGLFGATVLANSGFSVNSGILNSGDLDRIRGGETAASILTERIKQIIVIAAQVFEAFVNIFLQGNDILFNALGAVFEVLRLGAISVKEGIHNLVGSLMEGALNIAKSTPLLANLVPQLEENLAAHKAFGAVLNSERLQAEENLRARNNATREGIAGFGQNLNPVGGMADAVFRTLFPELVKSADTPDDGELFEAGPLERLQQFIYNNQERILETWQKIREINQEYLDDLEKVNQEREIQDSRRDEDERLSDFRRDRDHIRKLEEDYDNFLRNQAQRAKEVQDDIDRENRDYDLARRDREREFNRDQQRQLQDHHRRLAQIQEDARIQVMEAAAQLDAEGVFRAQEAAKQRTDEENREFNIRRKRQEEDFKSEQEIHKRNHAIRIADMIKEAEERAALEHEEYQRRRQATIDEFNQRRIDEEIDRNLRKQRLEEDRAREDALREEQRDKKINKLIAEMAQEVGLFQTIKDTITDLTKTAGDGVVLLFSEIVSGITKAINEVKKSFGTGGQMIGPQPGPRVSPGQPTQINWTMPIFDTGTINAPRNRDILVGVRGPEIISLGVPGRITSPGDTARLLRGAGGLSGGASFGDVHVHIDDIGSYSPEDAAEIVKVGLSLTLEEMMGHNPT